MSSGPGVEVVILCEDQTSEMLLRRTVKQLLNVRRFDVPPPPAGRGSGLHFVQRRFAERLQRVRSKLVRTALVVHMDGDEVGLDGRLRWLDHAADAAGQDPLAPQDFVACCISCRSIETWIAYLVGTEGVDETTAYPHLSHKGRRATLKIAADTLVAMVNASTPVPSHLPSLAHVVAQLRALRERLREG